jgi:serine kinase of HPr protein (carbohydrate metabolism regulator)
MTIPRQATCVAIGERGILIEGPSGSGKSSLALALLDRGAELIGDDGVLITTQNSALVAFPHPATRGLIEVRNLGLIHVEPRDSVPIALILQLDLNAPRYIETAKQETILGVAVPLISLWPDSPVLALRAEWALRTYGLD